MSHIDRINESIANEAERRLEELADREAESCHPRFVDWLCDYHDITAFPALISTALVVQAVGKRNDAANEILARECEWLRRKYRAHRVEHGDELPEYIAEIEQEARDNERERQYEDQMLRQAELEAVELRR